MNILRALLSGRDPCSENILEQLSTWYIFHGNVHTRLSPQNLQREGMEEVIDGFSVVTG